MTFLVMLCHGHQRQHHMPPMASLMTPMHFLVQDNQTEMQHDFFDHVMELATV